MAERKSEAARARALRRERFESGFAASHLAAAGAVISAAFLFQHSLAVKLLMLLAFIGATWCAGKRFSLIATLFVSATIVAANLLLPFGKVLFSLGPVTITQGALLGGIEKAVTFEGLMYASKACILPSLKLPGRFGSVVAKAFVYYDRIVEYKGRIRAASLISDVDELMLDIWESEAEGSGSAAGSGSAGKKTDGVSPAGFATASAVFAPSRHPVSGILILAGLSALSCLALLI